MSLGENIKTASFEAVFVGAGDEEGKEHC